MKLTVTHRVFLAILAANALIVLCMFLIMQWSMNRGFLKYVNRLEQSRMDRLAEKVGKSYTAWGGWEPLRNNPEMISPLISETVAEDPVRFQPPPVNNRKQALPNRPEPPGQRR